MMVLLKKSIIHKDFLFYFFLSTKLINRFFLFVFLTQGANSFGARFYILRKSRGMSSSDSQPVSLHWHIRAVSILFDYLGNNLWKLIWNALKT